MIFQRLFAFSRRMRRHTSRDADRGLLPVNRFKFFMERARFSANRNGTTFCLVSICDLSCDPEGSEIATLTKILQERLRITDDIGYLEDGRIGVLLPDTPEEGGYVVAEDIVRLYLKAGGRLSYRLYVYPSDFDIDGYLLPEDESEDTSRPAALPMEPMFASRLPVWKRVFDVVSTSILMVCFSPLFLVSSILVYFSSPGPVLFLQKRHGLGGEPFTILKYRTMRVGADDEKAALRQHSEQDGPAFKLKEDPRVTAIGRLLRTTSIDELPQLWNVLKGDMSLVGPRPLPLEETIQCDQWQRRRLDVTPGLTCIWQVRGRSRVSFDEWIRMDMEYIRSISFFNDLKLLLLTVPSVILRKGAH